MKSFKLPCAAKFTLAAEAQAMIGATGALEWTSLLLAEALGPSLALLMSEILNHAEAATPCGGHRL